MTLAGQTVTIITVGPTGEYDDLGGEIVARTETPVPGCRHRPLRADETPEWITNIATQVWQTTAPPDPAAMTADARAELRVDGVLYRVIGGAQPFTDETGRPYKVTILSQKQEA